MTDPTIPDAPEPDQAPTPPDPTDPPARADAELDEGGRAALKAERQARRDAERKARDAQDRAAQLERDAARRNVAADLDLTDEQAAFITGEDETAMREHAEKLLAAFRADPSDVRRRPTEHLKAGAIPNVDPSNEVRRVADRVMGGW